MNRIAKILTIIALMLGAVACVTESGDIGHFYGVWALRSMDIDGQPADIDCTRYFWKFEGAVIFITTTDDYHQSNSTVGSWSETDGELSLNFTYHNDIEGSENLPTFTPPPALGIPGQAVTKMKILNLTSKQMRLEWINDKGQTINYTLEKLK